MIEFIVGVLLAAAAVAFVLYPVLRPGVGHGTWDAGGLAGEEGDDPDDDLSRRAVAVRALREIEFDRATGKLSDGDYDSLRTKYTAEAVAASRAEAGEAGVKPRTAPAVTRPSSPVPRPSCPTHGPRPEPDAAFCSDCGRRLGTAPGYCARCGSALEQDARYCHACGSRIAA
ncbi:MAG TPA: zinc ribbon domain-containing protein [Gemmatimonadales bacterium]|nr:zinc ribbon domain-containing protein [Gemmatimonadales bacterium]